VVWVVGGGSNLAGVGEFWSGGRVDFPVWVSLEWWWG
jgi:hypothetical protein